MDSTVPRGVNLKLKPGYSYNVADLGPILDEHKIANKDGVVLSTARRGTPDAMRPEYGRAASLAIQASGSQSSPISNDDRSLLEIWGR